MFSNKKWSNWVINLTKTKKKGETNVQLPCWQNGLLSSSFLVFTVGRMRQGVLLFFFLILAPRSRDEIREIGLVWLLPSFPSHSLTFYTIIHFIFLKKKHIKSFTFYITLFTIQIKKSLQNKIFHFFISIIIFFIKKNINSITRVPWATVPCQGM